MKSFENRLIDRFSESTPENIERVNIIVSASHERDYKRAMNELAILSITQINSEQQKEAIRLLMTQLRTNMEEEEIAARSED